MTERWYESSTVERAPVPRGLARSHSPTGDDPVATTMSALKTRVSARVWPESYENAPLTQVVPLSLRAPGDHKSAQRA